MRGFDPAAMGRDERGVSEVVGVVLLIGLVLGSAGLVVVFGSTAMEQVGTQTDRESAELKLKEIDGALGTLSSESDVTRASMDIGDTEESNLFVERDGELTITVNDDSACRVNRPLTSIQYRYGDGTTLSYEAGGIWRQSPSNTSSMVQPPDLSIRNGTVDVTLTDVSGDLEGMDPEAVLDVSASNASSQAMTKTLRTGECVRPDNVTIDVRSRHAGAWEEYLTGQDAGSVESFANGTVRVTLEQSDLPRETNDAINQVVNLTEDGTVSGNGLSYSKGAGNTYTTVVRPMNGSTGVGDLTQPDNQTITESKPVDLIWAIDTSISLWDGFGFLSRVEPAAGEAMEAMGPEDRAGVVTFTKTAEMVPISGSGGDKILTTDPDEAQDTIGSIEGFWNNLFASFDPDSYESCINCATSKSMTYLSHHSNQSREKAVILFTDGSGTDSEYASVERSIEMANRSGERNVSINTVAVGNLYSPLGDLCGALEDIFILSWIADDTVNNCMLEQMANRSGGNYYPVGTDGQDAIERAFTDAIRSEKQSEAVTLTPITSVATTADGRTVPASVAGDSDDIATYESGGLTFPNLNDPTALSGAQHSFTTASGERVELAVSWYGCESWGATGTEQDGTSVARCTDIDESDVNDVDPGDVEVYLDGADVSGLLTDVSQPWEPNMTQKLDPVLVDADGDGDRETLDLESNQALVIFNLDPDYETHDDQNRLPMLYELGRSEEEARPPVVSLTVKEIDLE